MSSASRETIQVGALSVRFLVEAADSNGSASVFECFVPANSTMPAPHSHDAFEETIYGSKVTRPGASTAERSTLAPATPSAYRAVRSIDSTTAGPKTPRFLRLPAPAL